ncbi:MAG: hypothetical protein QOE85_1522 [Actinomycetota bacterium]|jgi:uncharacterized membrane protein HdeD (DUF308 family)|nr:hypothetical protein [Actinomycetota bacterium]MDQ1564246.1 hypothetical protein [Actinomycetota bacterium]MDQ1572673.1 hypothetical protein [Actinomycetota bacterium]
MASSVYTAEDAAYWYVPLSRAVFAAALSCVITFAGGNYTPEFGLFTFGGYGVVAGLAGIALSFRGIEAGVYRTVFLLQAIVTILAGLAAVYWWHLGLPMLIALLSTWAIIAGALELYAGLRSRRRRAVSRDWIFIGTLTVLFAIVILAIPPAYIDHYTGPDGKPYILNASVMDVGVLGVYGAIVAVYLAIAGLSLKWGPSTTKPEVTS